MNPQSPNQKPHMEIYAAVFRNARERGIDFAIGGGFAVAEYTRHRQSTKDIDLYVLPEDRDRMVQMLGEMGLEDLYDMAPYDRGWIYRSRKSDVIVDVMWSMPNRRAEVDSLWLTRGPEAEIAGERVRLLAPEELIWAKLYVVQRDRCDWPDILNLIHVTAEKLDWDHLLARISDDAPLLAAILTIYGWLCPDCLHRLPVLVEFLARPNQPRRDAIPRVDLLDQRQWFMPAYEPVAR